MNDTALRPAPLNVLLTCVGRRSYLVDYFRQALAGRGRVIAANSHALAAGMHAADQACVVPPVDDEDYIDALLVLCRVHRIRLLVSLFDIDLPYLAAARERFQAAGVELAVSDPWVIRVCNDKLETASFLASHGIATPYSCVTLDDAEQALKSGLLQFPLIVKPRWGMGSMSLFQVDDEDELALFHRHAQRQIERSCLNVLSREDLAAAVIIQQCVQGDEYGIDAFNDLQGRHLATVVKRKLAMRAGETDVAEVVAYPELARLGKRLATLFRHRSNIDIDVMVAPDGMNQVLEVNARFGGGYPFTHMAGTDFTRALIDLVDGREPAIAAPRIGLVGIKTLVPQPLACQRMLLPASIRQRAS